MQELLRGVEQARRAKAQASAAQRAVLRLGCSYPHARRDKRAATTGRSPDLVRVCRRQTARDCATKAPNYLEPPTNVSRLTCVASAATRVRRPTATRTSPYGRARA